MIFVDTSAWYANAVAGDANHKAATLWLRRNRQSLITTDYIIDETLTLLRSHGQNAVASQIGDLLFSAARVSVHYLAQPEVTDAWRVFKQFSDKEWSFTDCTSKGDHGEAWNQARVNV